MKRRIFDTPFAIFEEKFSSLRRNNESINISENGYLKQALGFHHPSKILCHTKFLEFCQNHWSLYSAGHESSYSAKFNSHPKFCCTLTVIFKSKNSLMFAFLFTWPWISKSSLENANIENVTRNHHYAILEILQKRQLRDHPTWASYPVIIMKQFFSLHTSLHTVHICNSETRWALPRGHKEMSSVFADQQPPRIWAQMRGRGDLRGLSQWVQLCTWRLNKLWRSNSIFNLCL